MEKLKELELTEMIQISGGVNVAYEIGYFVGNLVKKFTTLRTLFEFI